MKLGTILKMVNSTSIGKTMVMPVFVMVLIPEIIIYVRSKKLKENGPSGLTKYLERKMKRNTKYNYHQGTRFTDHGTRIYDIGGYKLPSVRS